MQLRSAFLALTFSFAIALMSCGGGSPHSFQNMTIAISPQIISIPVNGTQVFTTTVTNGPNTPLWGLDNGYGTLGSLTPIGATATYHAPPTPPIYTPVELANGLVQGSDTVFAGINGNGNAWAASTSVTFVITGPISAGISPTTASVKLGSTQQFTGYSVGSTNNALTWEVNGVAGGGASYGTINSSGLYTAPAAMPMTGNTVTITAVAQADTTKTASSTVTLTQ